MNDSKSISAKNVIVFGSSRSNGRTHDAINLTTAKQAIPIIDLADHDIQEFNYAYNQKDDFIEIIKKIMPYQNIILATPIYWYTMSAKMKIFVDRWSDLLSSQQKLGRKMQAKNLAVITSYAVDPEGADGFERNFINIAKYMQMQYLGCFFYYSGTEKTRLSLNIEKANAFIEKLEDS